LIERSSLRGEKVKPTFRDLIEARRVGLQRGKRDSPSLANIASERRVIIVEGISGSGKDTFQAYVKNTIRGRDVYDYSEGEVLHSWKHSPIEGIAKLRIEFMQLFVNHIRHVLSIDENALFLLNRFHLSTYVTTIVKAPALETEYDKIVKVLRSMPVHIFILRLEAAEIEERSLHSERSGGWQKYQQNTVTKDGFGDKLERYLWQQRLMIDLAKKQQIPYSILKSSGADEFAGGWVRVAGYPNNRRRDMRPASENSKIKARKRDIPRGL
jgi:thymidylate kinase